MYFFGEHLASFSRMALLVSIASAMPLLAAGNAAHSMRVPLPLQFPGNIVEAQPERPQIGVLMEFAATSNETVTGSETEELLADGVDGNSADANAASRPEVAPLNPNAVRWRPLLLQAATFAGVQHGFRFATERGTRAGMKGPFFKGWYDSLSSLHGWGDGDPFYVNYLGHPLQGAVSGFLFQANDPRYQAIEFGNNADYWKSRLRAAAFSFAYSTQFEIGPLSEASLGKIQKDYPQQGFVDHVATPTIGTLWMIGEDVLDRYVVRRVEGATENPWIRMMFRGWLNPARSFSNMMRFKVPWWRDSRPGVWGYKAGEEHRRRALEDAGDIASRALREVRGPGDELEPWRVVAPFEFSASTNYSHHPDGPIGLNCIGGGATAVWNRGPIHSWVADVQGCKLFTFDPSLSGDILHYRVGSRWTKRGGRLIPYGQILVGGKRATVEYISPEARKELERINRLPREQRPSRWDVVDRQQTNGLALSVAAGLELGISRAASFRLASIDYTRAWLPSNTLASYPDSFQVSMGMVLRVGTW